MLRKILIGTALFIGTVVGMGVYFMHRFESKWTQDSREQLQKLEPRITAGEGRFKKSLFYAGPNLGEIAQVLVGWPADREGATSAIVGKQEVHFLDAKARLQKQIRFAKPVGVPLETVQLNASGDYGFLTRDQSWAVDVILFDKSGHELWNYPRGFMAGVNDSTIADLGADGNSTIVVGFNGGGGLVLIDAQGKKLWQKPESNVWHVETLDIQGDGHREILHTNARGQLLVRNASGEVLANYLPGYYNSYFSLTRWGSELQPSHILIPTQERLEGCCKTVLLILDKGGETVAKFDAPQGSWIHRSSGTPVRHGKEEAYYAVLQTGLLPRSLLSIYGHDGKVVYQEVLGDRCLAINTLPGELADRLLIGCASTVWEYSPKI